MRSVNSGTFEVNLLNCVIKQSVFQRDIKDNLGGVLFPLCPS